jgi:hypothetical protein
MQISRLHVFHAKTVRATAHREDRQPSCFTCSRWGNSGSWATQMHPHLPTGEMFCSIRFNTSETGWIDIAPTS